MKNKVIEACKDQHHKGNTWTGGAYVFWAITFGIVLHFLLH